MVEEQNKPVEDVKGDGSAAMAKMAEVVCSDTTDVHGDFAINNGLQDLLLLSHGVVHSQFRHLRHLRYCQAISQRFEEETLTL